MTVFEKVIKVLEKDGKTNISFAFSVPNGISRLKIEYSYSPKELSDEERAKQLIEECLLRDTGENRKDYPSYEEFLPLKNLITLSLDSPSGYRGAAHRQDENQSHVLSESEASPGFIPGKITAGKWKVTLNVHAIVTEECVCRLKITADKAAEKKWYPCEMHCHTKNSDGGFTVEELLYTAKKRGLSGICLTDHNTTAGHPDCDKSGFTVLKGIEWTTYFGHMLVLDCDKYVDWRDALPDTIDEKIAEVKAHGGIVGIAHPFQLGTPICTGGHWDYNVHNWDNVSYIEVFSEGIPLLNSANRRAIEMWHVLLDKGHKIAPTFGRDWHNAENDLLKTACTYLLCSEMTASEMKNAVAHGKTCVSTGALLHFAAENSETVGDTVPAGKHRLHFTADTARTENVENRFELKEIRLVTNGGKTAWSFAFDESLTAEIDLEAEHWYSAELWGKIDGAENQLLAVTAAMYCKQA